MKDEFSKYLKTIGIEKLFFERAEAVVQFYEDLFPGQIEDIFVTEYLDNENKRQYEHLWLFTSTAMIEAKRFLHEDDFDFMPLKNQLDYWNIKKQDYDFKNSNEKSRMTVTYVIGGKDMGGEFKASRENCDFLREIFLKHIIPNMNFGLKHNT